MKGVLLFLCALCATALYAEDTWQTNYEVATKMAKEQNKPLLILFTGSDWCSWCQRLEKEVLQSEPFEDKITKSFVCLKIDFPIKRQQASDQFKQNQDLKAKYMVQGFPTIILLTPKLDFIGTVGYETVGGGAYAEKLVTMVENYKVKS